MKVWTLLIGSDLGGKYVNGTLPLLSLNPDPLLLSLTGIGVMPFCPVTNK